MAHCTDPACTSATTSCSLLWQLSLGSSVSGGGRRVLLVDKGDLASGTSSRPSRIPAIVGRTSTSGTMPTRWVGVLSG